jgi:hypothetical protein
VFVGNVIFGLLTSCNVKSQDNVTWGYKLHVGSPRDLGQESKGHVDVYICVSYPLTK